VSEDENWGDHQMTMEAWGLWKFQLFFKLLGKLYQNSWTDQTGFWDRTTVNRITLHTKKVYPAKLSMTKDNLIFVTASEAWDCHLSAFR